MLPIPLKFESTTTCRAPEEYSPPLLRVLGDIRDLTLGGSVGPGDSGSGSIQEF